jgi:hypothetical protein
MRARPADSRGTLVTAVVFSAIALLACAMPVHNDTWWHLKSGEATWNGRWPFVDHFSWTVDGEFFWNHSWLAQVILYGTFRVGGLPLLTALCAVAVVATWWLVWRECRGDAVERALLLGAAVAVSTVTWSVRPQVAIVLLPVVVKLTAEARIVPLALVMALWANLHAGFAVAAAVFAAGLGAALIYDRMAVRRRLIAVLCGGIATLATPLGFANWREVGSSLGRSRANAIIEWQPPVLGGEMLLFWATALAFVLLLAVRWRRLDSGYLQVSALAACVALLSATQAVRNVPAFMLLALPPLSAMLFAPRATAIAGRGWWRWALPVPLAAAAWLWTHPTPGMGWHPIGEAARSAIRTCRKPMFNTYGEGGPLIWFVPEQKVFVDSRQDPYPVSLIQEAVAVEQRGEYRETFVRRGINCAVLPPGSPAAARLAADGWTRRHEDERWVVLERPPATR